MAINVIKIKYPFSESAPATADEIRDIDPDKVVLTSAAKKIVSGQASAVRNSNTNVMDLRSIDSQIVRMIAERESIVSMLRLSSLTAVNDIFGFTFKSAQKIVSDFEKIGFSSRNVKKTVAIVRKALFDDEDVKFQEIACVGISFDNTDDELMFEFEHQPTGKCFRIDIPVVYDGHNKVFGEGSCQRKHDTETSRVFGIGVTYPFSSSWEGSIVYHYDIRVVREQIRLFVARGFEPVSPKLEGYVVRQWANGKPAMDISDYLKESQD